MAASFFTLAAKGLIAVFFAMFDCPQKAVVECDLWTKF
jgi:hypothetical protein